MELAGASPAGKDTPDRARDGGELHRGCRAPAGGCLSIARELPLTMRLVNALLSYGRYLASCSGRSTWRSIIPTTSCVSRCSPSLRWIRRGRSYCADAAAGAEATLARCGMALVHRHARADDRNRPVRFACDGRQVRLPALHRFFRLGCLARHRRDTTEAAAALLGPAAAMVLTLLSLATVAQTRLWRDSETLFKHTLSVTRTIG